MKKTDALPVWAQLVEVLSTQPMTLTQLKTVGYPDTDVQAAENSGMLTRLPKGGKVFYTPTYKGKRSYSVVKTDQIMAYSRAGTSVAQPASAPPKDPYKPPKWEPARRDANDALNIKSKGM